MQCVWKYFIIFACLRLVCPELAGQLRAFGKQTGLAEACGGSCARVVLPTSSPAGTRYKPFNQPCTYL